MGGNLRSHNNITNERLEEKYNARKEQTTMTKKGRGKQKKERGCLNVVICYNNVQT